MKLDELRADAERACAHYAECDEHHVYLTPAEHRAWNLAKFVRDLLGQETLGLTKYVGECGVRQTIYTNTSGYISPDAARAIAADLLRAAEQAESSASQAVHPGSPGDDTGRGT